MTTETFAQDELSLRYDGPKIARDINRGHLCLPNGVYEGFTPTVIAAASGPNVKFQLGLNSSGFSLARVRSKQATASVAVFITRAITIDLSTVTAFPVYAKIDASYVPDGTTTARIFTDTTAPDGVTSIGLCRIRQPGGAGTDIVIDAGSDDLLVPTYRSQPNASPNTYGFVSQAQIASVEAAAALVSEVTGARVDLTSFTHPDLSARLLADFAAVPERLSLEAVLIQGNDVQGASAASTVNVSLSFGSKSRTVAPLINIDAVGDPGFESDSSGVPGIAKDAPNNKVTLVDPDTGAALFDSSGKRIYGTITGKTAIAEAISSTFTNASLSVTGASSYSSVQAGDIVLGPDGNYYGVASVAGTTITLTAAYAGSTAVAASLTGIRVLMNLFVNDGAGGDTVHSLTANTDMRPFFNYYGSRDTLNNAASANLLSRENGRVFTDDQYDAITNASSPSSSAPFLTNGNLESIIECFECVGYVEYAKNGDDGGSPAKFLFTGPSGSTSNVVTERAADTDRPEIVDTYNAGTGKFTLSKPAVADVIYEYEIQFSGEGSLAGSATVSFEIIKASTSAPLGFHGNGGSAGPVAETGYAMAVINVDSSTPTSDLEFYVRNRAGSTITPNDSTSKLFIRRRGRLAP